MAVASSAYGPAVRRPEKDGGSDGPNLTAAAVTARIAAAGQYGRESCISSLARIMERMDSAPKRAAGTVVFRRTDRGVRLLVLRAYRNWDFPKGMIEPGESELEAAKRETAEETGLTELDFPFGEEHKDTLAYAGGKIARYFLAETGERDIKLPVSPELGRPEHHEWRWVSYEEAEELLPPRLGIVLEWARRIIG
jgi:bis(5'-nucleosidyl)-tetraphosphatase